MNVDGTRAVRVLESIQETAPIRRKASTSGGDASTAESIDETGTPESGSLASYLSAARSTPSSRADQVATLRAKIASGTYQIPIDKVVRGLLGESN